MRTCGKTLADDDLRDAIKDCGMGTVATRAAIIESIIKSGYVRRSGNFLVPTDDGKFQPRLKPHP
jgi:DNA topoisomerase-3